MSIAFTKKVVTNGRANVSQGLWLKIKNRKKAVDRKKRIHIKPLFFDAISTIFYKNKGTRQ